MEVSDPKAIGELFCEDARNVFFLTFDDEGSAVRFAEVYMKRPG